MQLSHSRISTYEKCPYAYKLRYILERDTILPTEPDDSLILGRIMHLGMETDLSTAISTYYNYFPIINDRHINEAIKFEYWIPKLKEILPEGEHEVILEDEDFKGYIDLLAPIDENTYDIYDFKYSNNVKSYIISGQLHIYKYFFEKLNPVKNIRKLYLVFIPKTNLKLKSNKKTGWIEPLYEYRQRLLNDMQSKELSIVEIPYNPNKVIEFLLSAKHCLEDITYNKKPTKFCAWCNFQPYCERGEDWMIINKEVLQCQQV